MTWAERRRHDLRVSHKLDGYRGPEAQERALRLVDQIVEYEALSYALQQQGAAADELERIEDAAWPVRELLRQLDDEQAPFPVFASS